MPLTQSRRRRNRRRQYVPYTNRFLVPVPIKKLKGQSDDCPENETLDDHNEANITVFLSQDTPNEADLDILQIALKRASVSLSSSPLKYSGSEEGISSNAAVCTVKPSHSIKSDEQKTESENLLLSSSFKEISNILAKTPKECDLIKDATYSPMPLCVCDSVNSSSLTDDIVSFHQIWKADETITLHYCEEPSDRCVVQSSKYNAQLRRKFEADNLLSPLDKTLYSSLNKSRQEIDEQFQELMDQLAVENVIFLFK
jgi:hypothetical protein